MMASGGHQTRKIPQHIPALTGSGVELIAPTQDNDRNSTKRTTERLRTAAEAALHSAC